MQPIRKRDRLKKNRKNRARKSRIRKEVTETPKIWDLLFNFFGGKK